jgi:hypothetical protein
MENEMILNRLSITGEIDAYTPKIVLEEIADSFGIKKVYNVEFLKNKISKNLEKNKIVRDYENDKNSLRIIARYINTHCKNWKRETLLKSFNYLKNYEYEIKEIKEKEYGLQTPENIYNLNACVIYRICKELSLNTSFESSLDEMVKNINMYVSIKNCPKFRNKIQLKIHEKLKFNSSASELVSICKTLNINCETNKTKKGKEKEKEKRKEYSYEDYNRCAENLAENLGENEENNKPKNNLEAIVMAAIYEKIDLSECEDPLTEYYLMLKKPYFPNDTNIIQRLGLPENSLRSPYLNRNFNPLFPQNMYSHRDLVSLVGEEGLTPTDEDYYTALQLAYLTETFIHGKQNVPIKNGENTFLEKINDLEYDRIVIYGIRNAPKSTYSAYTYAELSDTFASYKRFIDPITNQIFTDEAIEKLYILTQKDQREDETEEIYRERLDLGEEIERIRIYIKSKNQYVEEFLERYENLEEEEQKGVETALYNLLHASMYMRNWDGVGDYPLSSESTNFSSEKQIVVDDRVTQSLIDFEDSLEKLQKYDALGHFIINLPLMQYHSESNSFVTSNDEGEGLTIRDRIRIVRGGEEEGLNSCIRLTSNKFCATSYFYMVLLGFRLPFSITEVSTIF